MKTDELTDSISPIIAEPFDYTKWREHLFDGMTVEELSSKAMEYRRAQSNSDLL